MNWLGWLWHYINIVGILLEQIALFIVATTEIKSDKHTWLKFMVVDPIINPVEEGDDMVMIEGFM